MSFTLHVAGQPPLRTHPSRCADRRSPNAAALADAGLDLVRSHPERFPLNSPLRVAVTHGSSPPDPEGYDVTTAIEEVLVDVGMIADERLVEEEAVRIDPRIGDAFTVRVVSLPDAQFE